MVGCACSRALKALRRGAWHAGYGGVVIGQGAVSGPLGGLHTLCAFRHWFVQDLKPLRCGGNGLKPNRRPIAAVRIFGVQGVKRQGCRSLSRINLHSTGRCYCIVKSLLPQLAPSLPKGGMALGALYKSRAEIFSALGLYNPRTCGRIGSPVTGEPVIAFRRVSRRYR